MKFGTSSDERSREKFTATCRETDRDSTLHSLSAPLISEHFIRPEDGSRSISIGRMDGRETRGESDRTASTVLIKVDDSVSAALSSAVMRLIFGNDDE
jgi:hypothetical protein